MPDFPAYRWPPLVVVTPFHSESVKELLVATDRSLGSFISTAQVDELIKYFPFTLYEPSLLTKMSWIVGGTAAGNNDMGVYDAETKLLIVSTGLTAQGTISTIQTVDVTDTLLSPGNYYMAIKGTDATGTLYSIAIADELGQSQYHILSEAGGAGAALPSTMTPVSDTQASSAVPCIGLWFNDTLV